MARRKSDSPQKAALREMMSNYLKENDVHIKDGTDVNSIMRDIEYYGAAEPPVRWWQSHLSGLSEPPRLITGYLAFSGSNP